MFPVVAFVVVLSFFMLAVFSLAAAQAVFFIVPAVFLAVYLALRLDPYMAVNNDDTDLMFIGWMCAGGAAVLEASLLGGMYVASLP